MYPAMEANWSPEATHDRGPGALDQLDGELERMDKALTTLSMRIAPVSNQYRAEKVLAEPRPEPATAFLGRIERLRGMLCVLEALTADIDL